MATIAILTVGVTGCVNSGFEIARRLAGDGHDVVFASVNPRAAAPVEAQGHPFFQLDSGVPEALRRRAKGLSSGHFAGLSERRRVKAAIAQARGRAALAGYRIDEFLRQHEPDLLLVESELHESILYLLGAGWRDRLALLEYHVSVRRVPGVPPLSSSYAPSGPMAGPAAWLIWRWTLLKRRLRHRWARWYLTGWDSRSVWKRLARQAGFGLSDVAVEDQWPMLYYPDIPGLQLCAAEFDFPAKRAGSHHFVGPMIQASRDAASGDDEARRCRDLLARLPADGRPIVACAMGSILTLPRFVRQVIAAADGADFELIIATGRRSDPASFGALPPNVHAFRYIPQLEVLARASLFITHGGIASIHESLLAGVPMLVYSGGAMDENGNAARIAFNGLGLRGVAGRASAAEIRAKIEAALDGPALGQAVARMRRVLERYREEATLCRIVAGLLGARTGRRPS